MKKILLLSAVITILSIALVSTLNTTNASSSSPPNANAGAPADAAGATCAGCHGGSAVTQTTGVISSDIPVSGFIGGTTYNFTVTMSGAAAYSFEMTPQTATSNVGLGTWIAGVGTAVSTKYIKSPKKTGVSATWTFQWIAPATATTVTFYGAFNYANDNGTASGDVIKTSSVTYLANSTGIDEDAISSTLISVFPNPASSVLHIASPSVFERGFIYSINGSLVKTITETELINKTIDIAELSNGNYYITLSSGNKTSTSKFVKN